MHRRTGGNPFFAQQVSWLLKDGRTGVPPGVAEALGQRFASLPEASTAAVAAAAVAGPRFSADLVARATGQPPEAMAASLAEAVRARVLSYDGPDCYRFTHDLFREYTYHKLRAADRARLHQRIGAELEAERASGGEVSLAELAQHFVQADPGSARARGYCVAAAREATGRLAYEEAVYHWEGALAAVAGLGAALRIELLTAQGRLGELAGVLPQMFPDPESVQARGARRAGDGAARVRRAGRGYRGGDAAVRYRPGPDAAG